MQTKVLCLLVLASILAVDAKLPRGLKLNVALNETEFLFPSLKEKHHALHTGQYIKGNSIPNGIAIYSKSKLIILKIKFVINNTSIVCFRSSQRRADNFCCLT